MLSLARSINSASRTAQLLAPARLLATAAKAETEPAEDAVEGRRRRMGRNLYEFAQTLPENGLGYDIRPATWRDKPGCYYTLTELKLKEFNDVRGRDHLIRGLFLTISFLYRQLYLQSNE